MKLKTYEFGGMVASGRTVAGARAEMERIVRDAMAVDHTPAVLQFGGQTAVVWCATYSVCVDVRCGVGGARAVARSMGGAAGKEEFEKQVRQTKLHLAQMAWPDKTVRECLDWLGCPHLEREFLGWVGFQVAYRHARETSPEMGENAWHAFAIQHSGEFKPEIEPQGLATCMGYSL